MERERNIDGVRPQARSILAFEHFDSMIPWATALGYKSPKLLFADLALEIDMREGRRPVDLTEAIRLGIVQP